MRLYVGKPKQGEVQEGPSIQQKEEDPGVVRHGTRLEQGDLLGGFHRTLHHQPLEVDPSFGSGRFHGHHHRHHSLQQLGLRFESVHFVRFSTMRE